MILNRALILLVLLLSLTGCSSPAPTAALPTATLLVIPTQAPTLPPAPTALPSATPAPTATQTPAPTPTSPPSPTPTEFVPFTAAVWANGVNVRANPGYLFPAVNNVAKGTSFQVLGKAPGGEWIYVRTGETSTGWVFAQLLDAGGRDLQSAPIIQPEDVQIIRGRVIDAAGVPVSGIQFAITKGTGSNPPRNDAVTDVTGEFIAFMPENASGEWAVSYTAIACTSSAMDANCSCKDGNCKRVDPPGVVITLPHEDVLIFGWK